MRRSLSILLCLLCLLAPLATAETSLDMIPIATGEQTHIVRVLLSRLGVTDRLDLTLDGIYSAGNKGENSMIFERGSELTILLKGESLIVYYKGMSFNAGASLYFTRYQAPEGQENGIRLQDKRNLYPGDLELKVGEGVITLILHIPVEDYLLGVVPYEMSNDFPLEALKAQAVTARTYAIRRINPKRDYDVVDTTNDQVFMGIDKNDQKAAQAVMETKGVCGFYKDSLAECYYSASNGGQTELVGSVWSGVGDYAYYQRVDDPYDLANPLSVVKKATIPKNGLRMDESTLALRTALVAGMKNALVKEGFEPQVELVRIDEITALSMTQPHSGEDSRVYDMMKLTLHYSGKKLIKQAPVQLAAEDEVSLFSTQTEAPTPIPQETPAPTPSYTDFMKAQESVTVEIPFFPDIEAALSLSINIDSNELITVIEEKNAYRLEARRYGHGVGMSQRGAEWMAAKHDMSFTDILSFYYPGMTLARYQEDGAVLTALNQDALSTPGPKPTATPRPTLMPVSQTPSPDGWYAFVTEINDDSSLNLRASPDLSGEIVMRLLKNQKLLVVERCQEEGWLKVRTDATEGYVMEKFLTREP